MTALSSDIVFWLIFLTVKENKVSDLFMICF